MNIAIDFDSVLSNTIKKWIQIFNSEYTVNYCNLKLSYNKITQWDFCKMYGITHDDSKEIFQNCWEQWYSLEPTEFMLNKKTKTLSELYDTLDIVTANNPENKEFIESFLQKYDITYDSLIFEENKETLHHDIFIDDSPLNAQNILNAGKSVLLYNQPWNVDIPPMKTDTAYQSRVYSLDHAIFLLQNK